MHALPTISLPIPEVVHFLTLCNNSLSLKIYLKYSTSAYLIFFSGCSNTISNIVEAERFGSSRLSDNKKDYSMW